MWKNFRVFGFVLLILVLGLSGCAGTNTEKSAKALLITQATIIDVATSADQLCTVGTLNQSQCDEVKKAYELAKVHYDLVESALVAAMKTDSEDSWTNYQIVHENFQRIYGDLMAVALKYGIEGVTQ